MAREEKVMVKLSREIVHKLHNQGMTFADIGRMFGKSKQWIHSVYSGYWKVYIKTERYKMYKRHYKEHANPSKPCDYCTDSQYLQNKYPRQSSV